jgi:hypothetical protein
MGSVRGAHLHISNVITIGWKLPCLGAAAIEYSFFGVDRGVDIHNCPEISTSVHYRDEMCIFLITDGDLRTADKGIIYDGGSLGYKAQQVGVRSWHER